MVDGLRATRLALALLLILPASALSSPTTTVQRTMQDCDGDNLLDLAFGERHLVFPGSPEQQSQDACEERPDGEQPRLPPSASIINFLQLSDFQIVDEESPGRVEFLDGTQRVKRAQPFSAAYRPQESLTTQVTEAMVRQARNTTSPVTGRQLDLAILTGDNADSQQYNETRWFIDILDGTTGNENPDPEAEPPGERGRERKIHPDSGVRETSGPCETPPDGRYDGVRNSGQRPGSPDFGYYEPDSSSEDEDGDGADGDGYLPDRFENQAETGSPESDVTVRDFPGLLERANKPFEALGLGLPWYTAFGNHDALVQGNSPEAYGSPPTGLTPGPIGPLGEQYNTVFDDIATGCLKVKQPPPAAFAEAVGPLQDGIADALAQNPPDQARVAELAAQLAESAQALRKQSAVTVPPDRRRCYLAKDDGNTVHAPFPCETGSWIGQHFRTAGTPAGHGLAPGDPDACPIYPEDAKAACRRQAEEVGAGLGRPPQAIANHDGYYSFVPKPGLRFVVLDTVTDECGSEFCSEGSVDDAQFNWLRDQITRAAAAKQYVLAFSHHTLRTTRFPTADRTEDPVHYGERVDRRNPANPQFQSPGKTLEELYCESPNVIGHVAGHEHANYVERHDCAANQPIPVRCTDDDEQPIPCENTFFWQVSTAAHIDWPQQSRMIELVNMGGELRFVLTILDHGGSANPGGAPPPREEQGQAPDDVLRLASIGREIAYNDYQGDREATGGRQDRNVILPTNRPPPPYESQPPDDGS